MQIYLLAANLFALAALLLGSGSFSRGSRKWPLIPLFLLVISRSLSLIISLAIPDGSYTAALIGALEVFSTFCMVWTLTGLSFPWPKLAGLAGAAALLLSILPLIPNWPVPAQVHALLVYWEPGLQFHLKDYKNW